MVIDYWSRRRAKNKSLPQETVRMLGDVALLREQFEATGGFVERIAGENNPADLGFHR